jgi:hypothetical protein
MITLDKRYAIGALLLVVIAALGIGLGVGLSRPHSSQSTAQSAGASAPSKLPTMSPASSTIRPTLLAPSNNASSIFEQVIKVLPSYTTALLGNESSPQGKAWLWLNNGTTNPLINTYSVDQATTRFALAVFYYAMNGDNWKRRDGWLNSSSECSWYYNTDYGGNSSCSGDTFQIIAFVKNGLVGSLPKEIGLLTNLTRLTIEKEKGVVLALPTTIAQLTNLNIFEYNEDGKKNSFPSEIYSLSNLGLLDLSNNKFRGGIPKELQNMTNLTDLRLSGNSFTGTVPKSLWKAWSTNITNLQIDSNNLTGTVAVLPHLPLQWYVQRW